MHLWWLFGLYVSLTFLEYVFFFCQRKLQIQFQIIWKTCQKWLGLIIFSKVQSFLLFFWHGSIYIKAEFFIWHAAYFHLPPIVMEIHLPNHRQLKFVGEFTAIFTPLGYHICLTPSLLGWDEKCSHITKRLLARRACIGKKKSWRWIGWGWYDFVAMETVPTNHLFVIWFTG